jgi:hypothetical protein
LRWSGSCAESPHKFCDAFALVRQSASQILRHRDFARAADWVGHLGNLFGGCSHIGGGYPPQIGEAGGFVVNFLQAVLEAHVFVLRASALIRFGLHEKNHNHPPRDVKNKSARSIARNPCALIVNGLRLKKKQT